MATKYRAPRENRGILAVPSFSEVPAAIDRNRERFTSSELMIDGHSLKNFRAYARREILDLAERHIAHEFRGATLDPEAPLILSGHQPELFHPGVWFKNFSVSKIARHTKGVALNIVVDNDTLKSNAAMLKIPYSRSESDTGKTESVFFDHIPTETPYETCTIQDGKLFSAFPIEAFKVWKSWDFEPVLPKVWDRLLQYETPNLGERFARVRRSFERDWGVCNLELPVSQLSQSSAFERFARAIITDERFRIVHNEILQEFRKENQIRSRNHPVPDLAPGETSFWKMTQTHRERLMVNSDWKNHPKTIRPRALTLTIFLRLFVADYFLHGIGGGIYDQVADRIIERYYGIEPPEFQVTTATLMLPFRQLFDSHPKDVAEMTRRVRDVVWNPQRHLGDTPVPTELLARRELLLRDPKPQGKIARRERFRAFRTLREQFAIHAQNQAQLYSQQLAICQREASANRSLMSREYSWTLFPEEMLRQFMTGD